MNINNEDEKFVMAVVDTIGEFHKGDIAIVEILKDIKPSSKSRRITSIQISDIINCVSLDNGQITKTALRDLFISGEDFWLMDSAWTDSDRKYTIYYDASNCTFDITDKSSAKKFAIPFFVLDSSKFFFKFADIENGETETEESSTEESSTEESSTEESLN